MTAPELAKQSALYIPSPWQAKYHSRREDEVLGAGSAGPGKTRGLQMDIMEQVYFEHERCLLPVGHPAYHPFGTSIGRSLFLRRQFPMLKQVVADAHRTFPVIDPGIKWSEKEQTFTWSSGYKSEFGHCNNTNDWLRYQGIEYSHVAFDELEQFEEEQYEQIGSRVRTEDNFLRPFLKIRSMSNPFMRRESNESIVLSDPHWVRRMFVEPCREGNKILRRTVTRRDGSKASITRLYLPATLYDNPNKEFVADYERRLLGKPPHIRQALLYGNWWVNPGSHYADAWNENLHICRPFNIPDSWPRFRSMDWGFKSPGVVLWWAMDEDENLICEREYTFKERTDVEVARRIQEIERAAKLWGPDGSRITGPADDQLWERRGDSSKSKAEVFAENGVIWQKADKRSRGHNSEKFIKRLLDHRGGRTTPGIVFFSTCTRCIETIPGIQSDPTNPEEPLKGGEDHHHDAVLYGVAYASRGAAGIPSKQSLEDEDRERGQDSGRDKSDERGQLGYG